VQMGSVAQLTAKVDQVGNKDGGGGMTRRT